jgi:hypothetical protein
VSTDASIRRQIQEAESARATIHEEADEYQRKAYEQADTVVKEAAKRAEELTQEADSVLRSALAREEEVLGNARSLSETIITSTVKRARDLAADANELVGSLGSDLERQLDDIRRQQSYVNDFLQRMRTSSTDIVMAINSIELPKVPADFKPITQAGESAEELPEEVTVTINAKKGRA